MTEKSLQKSFLQHGVIKYGTVGDVFDPSLHDALFSVPDASKTSGILFHPMRLYFHLIFLVIEAFFIMYEESMFSGV